MEPIFFYLKETLLEEIISLRWTLKHGINLPDKFFHQKCLLYNNNELQLSYSERLW